MCKPIFGVPLAKYLLPDISKALREHKDLQLAAMLAWGEARSEGFKGMVAVVWVAKNRFLDVKRRWPNKSYKQVVLQREQFSCFNDNDKNLTKVFTPVECEGEWLWATACVAAFAVVFGLIDDPTGGANHYHAVWLEKLPRWARENPDKVTCEIGEHRFYKL